MIRVKEKCFATHEANVAWVPLVYGPLCRTVVVNDMGSCTSVCDAVQHIKPPRDVAIGLELLGLTVVNMRCPRRVRSEAHLASSLNQTP